MHYVPQSEHFEQASTQMSANLARGQMKLECQTSKTPRAPRIPPKSSTSACHSHRQQRHLRRRPLWGRQHHDLYARDL